jgi:hypothetical protein
MEIWSADLIGPFSTIRHGKRIDLSSRKEKHYALVVVDEYSRYVLIRLLARKSDAPDAIISLIKLLENKTDKKLKVFHSDGASELNGKTLTDYFTASGIDHTTTTPDTSEHNGITERMNRKLEETARCLISKCDGPQELCGDALQYSAVIHNHTAISAIGWKSPAMVMFSLERPNIDIRKLKVFGCDAYVHIDKSDRGKFQENGQPAVYLGYSHKENAHRLLIAETLTEVISRDVRFNELQFTHLHSITSRLVSTKEGNDTTTSNKKWTIDHIADERMYNGVKQYKVYWRGYLDHTWESSDIMEQDAPSAVGQYNHSIKLQEKDNKLSVRVTRSGRKTGAALVNTATHTPLLPSHSVIDYREPTSYDEALHHPDKEKWITAMKEELESISQHDVILPSVLPKGRKAIGCKWVYKVKRNDKNEIIRWKARLVIQGFRQKEGIDYNETFSPTVHIKSIKLLLAIAAEMDYEIKQIDFDTAFLNAVLDEEIYMKIPEGLHLVDMSMGDSTVLRLKKALYGLKQAPREWWLQLHQLLLSLGYLSSPIDECLYSKEVNGRTMYLTVYVDDMLAVFPTELNSEWEKDKKLISKQYKIKDMGDCEWILNMSVVRNRSARTITLSQQSYIELVLNGHSSLINPHKTVSTPYLYSDITACPEGVIDKELTAEEHVEYRSIVGELLYAATISRMDIAYIVSSLARYVNKPHNYHMAAAVRVLQYLLGREHYSLTFSNNHNNKKENQRDEIAHPHHFIIYSDSNWGGDKEDRKSVSGWISMYNGRPISWQSKKQSTVALSSTEAEFYALSEAVKEALFIRQWMKNYFGHEIQIEIRGDNMGSLFIADHTTSHNRTKHIDIKYFFIRNHIKDEKVRLEYVPTGKQMADILTKATAVHIFEKMTKDLLDSKK